jgi:hypothetical protein
MRVFHRFGLDSSLAIAVLGGMGTAALLARVRRTSPPASSARRLPVTRETLTAVGLIAIVILDLAAAPLPYGVTDARGLETDLWLKQQPGDFSVMELPLVRGLNGPGLYRAAIHGKKISYGYGTFYPKEWREAMQLLANFPTPEGVDLLRSWNVRYVLLGEGAYKAGMVDTPGDTWEKVQERLQNTPDLRYVRTFDEVSPAIGDRLSSKLTSPWLVVPAVVDRTDVYQILPKQ